MAENSNGGGDAGAALSMPSPGSYPSRIRPPRLDAGEEGGLVTSVLYVDDEPPLRKAVHAWLGQQGVDVESARSIAEATEVLGRRRFDGAFIDIWLSDGSGFEVYDWIASHDPRLAQRVVFI